MKHIKTFESFDSVNEWRVPSRASAADKQGIMDEIEWAIDEYNEHPEDFIEYDEDELRDSLLQSAEENGFRGEIEIRKSADDPRAANPGKLHIIYTPKNTALQNIGSAAGRSMRV
jgi:hypothetical protein